jgi:cytoskeleton protein RodZ
MSSVGETLRRERLRTGLDLERISQETKISVRMLELIEADQFEKLPGGVFAKSFVRQYARAMGIDEDELVRELEKTLEPAPDTLPKPEDTAKAQPEIHVPRVAQWSGAANRLRPASSLPALALVVLVMLACSAAYTWWQKSRHTPQVSALATEKIENPAAPQPPGTPQPTASSPTASAPSVAQAPVSQAPPTPPAISMPVEAGALNIALTAEEPTWVRAATANGKIMFSGILQPNETKSLSAVEPMTLRIGNAGGVAISLNGKSIPAVGPKGQVRTVQLSPDGGVQVVAPVKVQPPQPAPTQQTQSL